MEFAVIVLNWNNPSATIACLGSVCRAGVAPADIIVVDNGSTDGSVARIRSHFPDAAIVENCRNLGFAGGMNAGIRHALGHGAGCVLILNNDVVLDAQAVSALRRAMDADLAIGAAGPRIYVQGTHDLWFAGGRIDWRRGTYVTADGGCRPAGAVSDVDAVSGCVMMLRAAAIASAGLFDESYFMYAEDVDISVRIRRAGFRVVCVPDATAWHAVGASVGGSASADYFYYITRSRLRFMKKLAPRRDRLFFVPYFILTVPLRQAICLAWQGRLDAARAVYRGIRDHLLGRTGPAPGIS